MSDAKKPKYIYRCLTCGHAEEILAQNYSRKPNCEKCNGKVSASYDNGNGKKRFLPEYICKWKQEKKFVKNY